MSRIERYEAPCGEVSKALLRRIAGKLLVIWDGSPIHRSKAVREFLTMAPASGCNSNNCLAMLLN